jgi:hypothetical protein
MRLILALIACLFVLPAYAQVKQSGNVTPGHGVYWVTNGVVGDAGTPTNPNVTSFATVGSGPTLCADSAKPTSGPYNQLCFAPTNTGGGFTWYNYNGATGVPSMTINGTVYPFPFSSPGGIVGPSTTVVNDLAVWGNTAGTLLADLAGVTGATNTVQFSSANTAFANQFYVINTGTTSNVATEARVVVSLASPGSGNGMSIAAIGGAIPYGLLSVGSNLQYMQITSPTDTFFLNNTYNTNNLSYFGPGTGAHGQGESLAFRRQNGSTASPTAILSGDELGFVQMYGWDGASFSQSKPNAIVFHATENYTGSAHGTAFVVQATPNTTTAGQDELYAENGITLPCTDGVTEGLGRGSIDVCGVAKFGSTVTVPGGTTPVLTTTASITSGAGSGAGTLTNAPTAGNPTKWIPINDNGTTRYIPAW